MKPFLTIFVWVLVLSLSYIAEGGDSQKALGGTSSRILDFEGPLKSIPVKDLDFKDAPIDKIVDVLVGEYGVPCSLENVWPEGTPQRRFHFHFRNGNINDVVKEVTKWHANRYIWTGSALLNSGLYNILPHDLLRDDTYIFSKRADLKTDKPTTAKKALEMLFDLPILKSDAIKLVQPLPSLDEPSKSPISINFEGSPIRDILSYICRKAGMRWMAEGTPEHITLRIIPIAKVNSIFSEDQTKEGF